MLIGVRLLILIAGVVIASTFLGWVFTKNARLLKWCKTAIKVTAGIAVLIVVLVVGERFLMML